jgi:hypothetical protein
MQLVASAIARLEKHIQPWLTPLFCGAAMTQRWQRFDVPTYLLAVRCSHMKIMRA